MEALGFVVKGSTCVQFSGSFPDESGLSTWEFTRPVKARAWKLPRKEVIQPHVPVRLPCYDFVPVTSLTLNACLACALAQRLQVLPASMT